MDLHTYKLLSFLRIHQEPILYICVYICVCGYIHSDMYIHIITHTHTHTHTYTYILVFIYDINAIDTHV